MNHKCYLCKKKLKLHEKNIQCKCGYSFCMKHIHKHSHNCPTNSKLINQKNIIINNPKISTPKIIKI